MRQLNWGLVGGGEGSQIGPVHRMASRLDGRYRLVASALDQDPKAGVAYAKSLGVERAYGTWREMLRGESGRSDRPDLVTVATPNSTHHEISKAFLDAGISVLCEKPMTSTVEEALDIERTARERRLVCAVSYGYSGYPLARQMREMAIAGELGKARLVFTEFSHGHLADSGDNNPRARWRFDPETAGVSAQFADCGIHALHLATFVTGQRVDSVSADFASCAPGRELEDDAMVNFRMDGGCVGRLWTSGIATGRQHGLRIQVFGEKAGLQWSQERPGQLYFTRTGGRTEIIERGEPGLAASAAESSRTPPGHAEGMPLAFANIYSDIARAIMALKAGEPPDPAKAIYPTAGDGLAGVRAIHACVESAKSGGAWVRIDQA